MDYPFDQYQRYKNVEEIINRLRKKGQSFKILEVGANEHRNLEVFLPDDTITYLDIQLPEHLMNDPQYILGDATNMEFEDNTFDIIVAMDVFEHIFPEQRQSFIRELQRVSQEFFVITAPFDSDKVRAAEKRLNTLYRSIYNEGYIWLEEHYINGLPILEELTQFLIEQNIKYNVLSHGNVDIWERMMSIHFFAVLDSRMTEYRKLIDRFYNENIYSIDYISDSYRKIVVCYTNESYSSQNIVKEEQAIDELLLNKLQFLEQQFHQLLVVVKDSKPPHMDCLQIYVDDGEDFKEETSLKQDINVSENKEILFQFELSNYSKLQHIRIDPSHYKGAFRINNITLTDHENRQIEMTLFVDKGYHILDNVFLFTENDPYIILKPEEATVIRGNLTFSVQYMGEIEMITALVQESAEIERIQKQKTNVFELKNQELKETNEKLMDINNELNHKVELLNDEKTNIEAQREQLNQEKNEIKNANAKLQNELQNIINSRSFRLAKFLQKFKIRNK